MRFFCSDISATIADNAFKTPNSRILLHNFACCLCITVMCFHKQIVSVPFLSLHGFLKQHYS